MRSVLSLSVPLAAFWLLAGSLYADSPAVVSPEAARQADAALGPLLKRLQDRSDREQLRLDLLALRRAHPGTPAAGRAAELLTHLPSPPDRLDPAKIDRDDRFDNQPKELVAILKGHTRAVAAVAFAPDGTTLASSGWDNRVRLWKLDGAAPAERATLPGSPSGVVFSPDGRSLACGGDDARVCVWDLSLPEPKEVRRLAGHRQRPFAVAYSPNGKLLVSGCFAPVLCLWDLRGKKPEAWGALVDDEVKAVGIASLAFSPDGKTLAAGSHAGTHTLRLWDVSGNFLTEWDLPRTRAVVVAFSPDGRTLAFHGEGATIRLWHIEGGKHRPLRVLPGHPLRGEGSTVRALAFSPDGKVLASAGRDRKLILWDPATGNQLRAWALPAEVRALAFAADGRHLATGNENGAVFLLRLAPAE
jgi:WD40 repeat protein